MPIESLFLHQQILLMYFTEHDFQVFKKKVLHYVGIISSKTLDRLCPLKGRHIMATLKARIPAMLEQK